MVGDNAVEQMAHGPQSSLRFTRKYLMASSQNIKSFLSHANPKSQGQGIKELIDSLGMPKELRQCTLLSSGETKGKEQSFQKRLSAD